MTIVPEAIYKFNTILIKILMAFFEEREKPILKFMWNLKEPQVAENRRMKLEDLHILIFILTTKPQ